MQTLGSIPKHGISLCMVERRWVEEEHREHSFQAIELFIIDRKPTSFSSWYEKRKIKIFLVDTKILFSVNRN